MKILIVRTSSLGDVVQTFPVLHYLRARFPTSQIDWAVEKRCASLVAAHLQLNRTLLLDSKRWTSPQELLSFRKELRKERYDCLFDLQGNCKSGLVTLLARADEKVGWDRQHVAEWPNLVATRKRYGAPSGLSRPEEYLACVQAHLRDRDPFSGGEATFALHEEEERVLRQELPQVEGRILIAPFSAWPSKELTLEWWGELCKEVYAVFGLPFLMLWGSERERQRAAEVVEWVAQEELLSMLSQQVTLPTLHSLMKRAHALLGVDSLPLHLCGTTQTPTFSFFGPSLASSYRPSGERQGAFQAPCPLGVSFSRRCPRLRHCPAPCLKGFQGVPQELWPFLSDLVDQRSSHHP